MRPAEVDVLLGNADKARDKLGGWRKRASKIWSPKWLKLISSALNIISIYDAAYK